jgi:hypothetical protein
MGAVTNTLKNNANGLGPQSNQLGRQCAQNLQNASTNCPVVSQAADLMKGVAGGDASKTMMSAA